MTILDELNSLPKELTEKNKNFIQQLPNLPKNKTEAENVLQQLAQLIKNATSEGTTDLQPVNQVLLNLAYRAYYQLQQKFDLQDEHFEQVGDLLKQENGFNLLYAILLTDKAKCLNAEELRDVSLAALSTAVEHNSCAILSILKALNLLCKKFPQLNLELPLEHAYCCLQQPQSGLREEIILLLNFGCKQLSVATKYFVLITEFWPWTSRYKLYILSCILNSHCLHDLLSKEQRSDFFEGIRLSLRYKNLLAASQYVVKSLSKQNSTELIDLCVNILVTGNIKELQNFYGQWFGRITQKQNIFNLLQQKTEIAGVLDNWDSIEDEAENYRLVLIFSMFARQIFDTSKLHFFKISTVLITNCFQFHTETQILIYKVIVDNIDNFAIEDCLEFIIAFINHHKGIQNAQFRNNILDKIPNIINYVAKTYNKLAAESGSSLEASIIAFFQQLQYIIEDNIVSVLYQPKIFSLKLLEQLLKSLYAQTIEKNSKNCCIAHNQKLGAFLVEQKAFNERDVVMKLLDLLNDPFGFDDVLELIVSLLRELNYIDSYAFDICKDYARRIVVEECVLTTFYTKVAVQCMSSEEHKSDACELYNSALHSLKWEFAQFKLDPFLTLNTRCHLFGYVNILNEILFHQKSLNTVNHWEELILLHNISNELLKYLNLTKLSGVEDEEQINTAASFQDMDESLNLLIERSAYETKCAEKSRIFLLMSFWLTFKACCDLATTIGCLLVPTSVQCATDLSSLELCLKINTTVLRRCRHKGAIEAAGLSIGKLSKCITKQMAPNSSAYKLLHDCIELLFFDEQQVSNTRRGAGFSIMFLHIVKNEVPRGRPLLKGAINKILTILNTTRTAEVVDSNFDRLEALTLHYLCVLLRDAELREAMTQYQNEIVMSAIKCIDNPDWVICNAALQLFGALIPKIVGQKQSTEFETPMAWESAEITHNDIIRKLPQAYAYMLRYCAKSDVSINSTRSVILFLEFFVKVEHVLMNDPDDITALMEFRTSMWTLLSHNYEKVRKLAAICLIRAHEFRYELPHLLLSIASIIFNIKNENFFEGLIFTLIEGLAKINHESLYITTEVENMKFLQSLQAVLLENFKLNNFKCYTLCKLIDLLLLVNFDKESLIVTELVKHKVSQNSVGYEDWIQKIAQLAN
ncbi:uncharacterized protein LOC119679484 [Teleopsis dalmanni]|uniref:uncharacterized protein LOC119679484 n=1 Tax=Teleopsis dalmanni TaxID=139649 RepID=UPI0018CC954B|nr:uncharacterized protein LOC119679484 [Teleopsis dalmanni]